MSGENYQNYHRLRKRVGEEPVERLEEPGGELQV